MFERGCGLLEFLVVCSRSRSETSLLQVKVCGGGHTLLQGILVQFLYAKNKENQKGIRFK